MIRKLLIFCLYFSTILCSYGDDYPDFFNKVKEHNRTIRIEEINRSIAQARYDKAMITARGKDEKIIAEIAYQSALLSYRAHSKDIHTTLFSLIIDTLIKEKIPGKTIVIGL